MKVLTRTLLVALVAIVAHGSLSGQWTIGEPNSMELSTLTMYSLDVCPPTPTHVFWFPISEAAGVDHIAIVEALDSPDIVEIGTDNPVSVGDTILITNTDYISVYFYAASGMMTLKFYATGTPTVVGDPVPCVPNELWSSTLPICYITNNPAFTIDGDCTVEEPNSVYDLESLGVTITWPSASSGYQLSIDSHSEFMHAVIYDQTGKNVAATNSNRIECQHLSEGVYVLSVQAEGKLVNRSFVLSR